MQIFVYCAHFHFFNSTEYQVFRTVYMCKQTKVYIEKNLLTEEKLYKYIMCLLIFLTVLCSENCVVRNIMLIEKIIKIYFWTQRIKIQNAKFKRFCWLSSRINHWNHWSFGSTTHKTKVSELSGCCRPRSNCFNTIQHCYDKKPKNTCIAV